jgi:hypothetical protein
LRRISVFTPLTAIGIRKKSEIRLDTVFYPCTTVYGPTRSTWDAIVLIKTKSVFIVG